MIRNYIIGSLIVVLLIAVFGSLWQRNEITRLEASLQTETKRADDNAEAVAQVAKFNEEMAAIRQELTNVNRRLSQRQTTIVERIANAPADQGTVPPVIVDTARQLRDAAREDAGSRSKD